MINKWVGIGRLTKDADMKRTQSNKLCANFTLACNRNAKGQDGRYEADFINCVAWNKTAEIIEKYTRKGSLVGVEGRIQTRNYQDSNSRKVYVTEIIIEQVQLLEKLATNTSQPMNQGYNAPQEADNTSYGGYGSSVADVSEYDLPF